MKHNLIPDKKSKKPMLLRVYSWLLGAYPAPFRQEYSAEMAEVFADLSDEAASQGTACLAWFAAREAVYMLVAIARAYWSLRGSLARRGWVWFLETLKGIVEPGRRPVEDGRTSWQQAALEMILFALSGLLLIVSTYLPVQGLSAIWQNSLGFMSLLILVGFILWLLAGLAREMPRWAYPSFGIAIGYSFYANRTEQIFPAIVYLVAAAAVLLALEMVYGSHRPLLNGLLIKLLRRLRDDPTLVSFGLYGSMPLAIIVGFSDVYDNNRTLWMLAAVLAMNAGAVVYCRCRKPFIQSAALMMGVLLTLFSAAMDHNAHVRLAWFDVNRYLSLCAYFSFLVIAPPVTARLYLLMKRVKARSRAET
jgi:hypothetical protein